MKAIALTGEQAAGVIDVPFGSSPGLGEVTIRMRGLGLCGSDLSRYLAHRAVPSYPWVIGHEGFGTITAVGRGVDAARIGETVVIEPIIGCGGCHRCADGDSALCDDRRVLGMTEPGVGSEYVVLPSEHVHAVPSTWSSAVLGSIEPLAVATKAVERAEVSAAHDVLVVGGGAQGILIAMLLEASGVRVEIAEIDERTRTFVAERGLRLAGGSSVYDRVFEASGSAGGFATGLRAVAPGGAIMLVGMGAAPLQFTSEDLVLRQVRILTSYVYDHPHGFRAAIDAVASGAINPEQIVSAVVGATDVQSGYETALGEPGKVVLDFEEWIGETQ